MERLLKEKDMYTNSFNRQFDDVQHELKRHELNIVEIQGTMKCLTGTFESLNDINKKIIDFMLDDDTLNDNIDDMKLKIDEITKQFNTLQVTVDFHLNKDILDVRSQASVCSISKRRLKLPTIEFKKFAGDIKDWLSFWSQFRRIHEDEQTENEDKFQYLIQATTPKSRARQLVESYPPTAENYNKVIESLKSRFGREDLLIEMYVRELLKLVLNNLTNRTKLSFLYDKMETQLRALDTLGVTTKTCAAILYPLVESCLPEELLRVWQRNDFFSTDHTLQAKLENIMKFLKREVENEERILLATSGFDLNKQKKIESNTQENPIPTASGLINQNKIRCIFCKKEHSNDKCDEAVKIPFLERKKISSSKGCCHACLKFGHIARKCRTAVKLECATCKGKHVTLMCPAEEKLENRKNDPVENLSNQTYHQVFLQTLTVDLHGNDKTSRVRAIIDTGSQRSYILKQTATENGYEVIKEEELIHGLFGGYHSEPTIHSCYKVKLKNPETAYTCSFEALDQKVICGNITPVCNGSWISELKGYRVTLSDISDGPIQILLGADVAGKLLTGKRHILQCGLVAIETKLGWTLMGKVSSSQSNLSSLVNTSLHCKEVSVEDLWSLDVLGISDPVVDKSRKEIEEAVMQYFLETVTRSNDGRYEVKLPWVTDHPPLPSNFYVAQKRLESLGKKLQKDGYYNEYDEVFKDWLKENIIEEVPIEELDLEAHYLPHHHVIKLSSTTTKIRPVFDASAKQSRTSPSLNQCLEKGINLIELIPSILIRFRQRKIGVIADIRKAFLQISLNHSDRNFLRFLWFNKHNELVFYRHARVVFGTTCSPFLLGAVIEYHINRALTNSSYSKSTLLQLIKSFYVDNCVTSLDYEESLQTFIKESTAVMADGQFDLRTWEYTSDTTEEHEIPNLSAVLGLKWNKQTDTLELCWERIQLKTFEKVTKKIILSVASRIFDPIGFACPVLLCPKILLQKTCSLNLGWNSEVPDNICQEFTKWLHELDVLADLKIPRWLVQDVAAKVRNTSIHLFCDASKEAYASAIFIRTKSVTGVRVQLIQARCRVSPIKKMSICRLELLATSIGARLLNTVMKAFEEKRDKISVYCWTDSTTVLSWIKRNENWKPFVRNRIQEIRSLTDTKCWYYVPGELNPADLPSRGCSTRNLIESSWWEGPTWLMKPFNDWPTQTYQVSEDSVITEKQKSIIGLLCKSSCDNSWLYLYFSKFQRIVNMISWMNRFIFNTRNSKKRKHGSLSTEEIEASENQVITLVQQEAFNDIDDKQFGSLIPFKDEEGILRLRTKISEREDLRNFRFPALLPSKHPVVRRLIYDKHIETRHSGTQTLLSILREKYWIIGGRKSIRSVISKCIRCRRNDGKHFEACPVALPKNRVRDAAVFEVIGVDMAGPLFLRDKTKVWICIFTCAIYRAVHLELVTSLSTDCFLQALRRFISRRGRPAVVYSDHGSNFVGTENLFSMLDWEQISNFSTVERIKWKFNPPTSAWWGGWWERLIGVLKKMLKKVLGKASLNYEELLTLICDCESVINSRPITYVYDNNSDMISLTPSMFLQEIKEIGVPDLDAVEAIDLRSRYKYRMKLRETLRSRFRNEYLGCLTLRKKKFSERKIKKGDIVLVGSDNSKRINWPMARVEELIPGKDGETRLFRLKTENGILLRPLQRLFPLEIYDGEEQSFLNPDFPNKESYDQEAVKEQFTVTEIDNKIVENKTRSGRKVKPPDRLSYC